MISTVLTLTLSLVCAGGAAQAGPNSADPLGSASTTREWKVCGQRCLTSILQYFGKSARMEDLFPIVPASRKGSTLAQLKAAAESYELHALGAQVSPEVLFTMRLPVVLHVNDDHFVALMPEAEGAGFTAVDPPDTLRIPDVRELAARWKWQGNCLFISSQDIVLPKASSVGWAHGWWAAIVVGAGLFVWVLGRRWILSVRAPSQTHWFGATLLGIAFFLGSARSPVEAAERVASSGTPRILAHHPVFDAGIVFDDTQEISHAFEISNKGTADLVVKEIKTDCSCTAVESNRIKTIPPGASTSLTVRFHLGERFGKLPERKTLLVTNDPVNPKTVLVIRAERHREFTLEPSALLPGLVPVGTDKILFLRVTAHDNRRRARVEKATASCPFVQVSEVKGADEDAKKGVRLLKVHVLPTAPSGPLEATIRIPCTGGFRQMLEVRLRGEIVGPIRLSLAQLQFGLIAADSRPATRRVVLTSAQPFAILALKGSPAWVSVAEHGDGHDDGRRSVVVTLVPGQGLKGRVEGLVTVETDVAEMRVIRIPVFAYFL